MITVRPAVPDDAPEVVRLRRLMFEAMAASEPSGPSGAAPAAAPIPVGEAWERRGEELLRRALADPGGGNGEYGVFVVDDPGSPGVLAACAVGTLEQRLPAPAHPEGLFGFVFNICTDPGHRRQGYARACTEALLDWFDRRGATRLDLHATQQGQELYRSLGFHEHSTALSRTRPAD